MLVSRWTGLYTFAWTPPNLNVPYTMIWQQCNRISTLMDNNHDLCTQLSGTFHPHSVFSPRSTAFYRQFARVGVPISFRMPSQSPQSSSFSHRLSSSQSLWWADLPLSFRMAAAAESFLNNPIPLLPAKGRAGAFELVQSGPASGVISWTPAAAGFYAVQIKLSDTLSEIPIDFVIQVFGPPTTPAQDPYFSPSILRTVDCVIGLHVRHSVLELVAHSHCC